MDDIVKRNSVWYMFGFIGVKIGVLVRDTLF